VSHFSTAPHHFYSALSQKEVLNMQDIMPISALGQNSRNEKHIQTSITGRSLHRLTEFVTRRLQEEMREDPP
jgi:hypothetical protein